MTQEAREISKEVAQTPTETERTRNRKVYVPKVDIYETKDSMVLIADMPGVDESSVDLTLEKSILTISGAVAPVAMDGYSLAYTEYDTGDYQRAFTLSEEMDKDRIEATVKSGVLRVVLYKAKEAKAKKISIKAEK